MKDEYCIYYDHDTGEEFKALPGQDCNGNGQLRAHTAPNSWMEECMRCAGRGYIRRQKSKPIKEEKKGMNYSTAVMLINDNIRAVRVSYEVKQDGIGIRPFVMFKTLDHTINVGDMVVVPTDTRHKKTVVRVEEVDAEVDFESDIPVQWVVGKVESDDFNNILIEEQKWIDQFKAAEKHSKKKELKKKVFEFVDEESMEKLKISNMSDVTTLEAPIVPADDKA